MPRKLVALANVALGIHEPASGAPAHPELTVDYGQGPDIHGCHFADQ
jgi:hypothetical protein